MSMDQIFIDFRKLNDKKNIHKIISPDDEAPLTADFHKSSHTNSTFGVKQNIIASDKFVHQ